MKHEDSICIFYILFAEGKPEISKTLIQSPDHNEKLFEWKIRVWKLILSMRTYISLDRRSILMFRNLGRYISAERAQKIMYAVEESMVSMYENY